MESHQTIALVVLLEECRLLGVEDAFPNWMFRNGEKIECFPRIHMEMKIGISSLLFFTEYIPNQYCVSIIVQFRNVHYFFCVHFGMKWFRLLVIRFYDTRIGGKSESFGGQRSCSMTSFRFRSTVVVYFNWWDWLNERYVSKRGFLKSI